METDTNRTRGDRERVWLYRSAIAWIWTLIAVSGVVVWVAFGIRHRVDRLASEVEDQMRESRAALPRLERQWESIDQTMREIGQASASALLDLRREVQTAQARAEERAEARIQESRARSASPVANYIRDRFGDAAVEKPVVVAPPVATPALSPAERDDRIKRFREEQEAKRGSSVE